MTGGSPEVDVRPSFIEGLGVFALRPFDSGERIRQINVVREVTADAPLREELGERADHCDYSDGRIVLWGSPDRHVNHSCDPNAFVLYQKAAHLKAEEDAAPGFYTTLLSADQIRVELSATERTGIPRYTYLKRGRKQLVLDFGEAGANTVVARVGISTVSPEGAWKNLRAENLGRPFQEIGLRPLEPGTAIFRG